MILREYLYDFTKSPPSALIGADQICLAQDMAPHDLQQLLFFGLAKIGQHYIEGIKLEKIAMASNGGQGPP
jgi:hypothetical protein